MKPSNSLAFATTLVLGMAPIDAKSEDLLRFQSYESALNSLLAPDNFAFTEFTGTTTSCPLLTSDPNELSPDIDYPAANWPISPTPPSTGSLGPNLSRHCGVGNNSLFGSSLSSGFSSGIPTRTFLPFSGSSRRPSRASASGDNGSIENTASRALTYNSFLAGDLFLVPLTSEPNLSLIIDFGDESIDATDFEAGSHIQEVNIAAIAQFPRGDRSYFGFGLNFGTKNGDVDAPSLNRLPETTDPSEQYLEIYQNACGLVGNGEIEETSFGAFAFAQRPIGRSSALNFDFGVNYAQQKYSNDLCIFSFENGTGEVSNNLFAGEITGRPDSFEIVAAVSYQTRIDLGRATVYPSIGLRFSHEKIDSYTETETTIDSINDFLEGREFCTPGVGCSALGPANLTGASLTYDAQDITSIQSEIGGTLAVPVSGQRWNGNLFLDAFYFHEFNDDQREVVAQFAEDGRDNPTRFSFLVNPPSQNYFEVGLGLQAASTRDGRSALYLRASTILGDDIRDGYRLGGAWQFVF